jgi:hypothetical protein
VSRSIRPFRQLEGGGGQGHVGRTLGLGHRRQVGVDRLDVATRGRSGQGARRAVARDVGEGLAREGEEVLELEADLVREPLDLTHQRHQVVRRHGGRRVIERALRVLQRDDPALERAHELSRHVIARDAVRRAAQSHGAALG